MFNGKYKMKIKKSAGITLVALVVTIVVLLILAGITINLILGPNSIFETARKAGEETNKAVEDEQKGMNRINEKLEEGNWGSSGENPEVPKGPNGKPLVETVKTTDNTENTDVEDKNGNPITIPAGFKVLPNGEDGVEYNHEEDHSPCVEDGIVIQDSSCNQFVWVPVNEEQYVKIIDETNKRGNLYDFGSYNSSTQTWTPYDEPLVKKYSATGFREPDIVTSYTSEGTTYNGDEVSSNYLNANIKDKEGNLIKGKGDFKTLLEAEFDEMAASVKKHKGFYIGRYETGDLQAVKDSIPVVQRGNTNISDVNWYYQYANSKNIAKNDKYTSSMIWGCQWEATLEWLVNTNRAINENKDYTIVTNSSSWGNYKDQTFEYKKADGTMATKSKDTSTKIPTGSTERNKKNNIYDMAGNVYDWTIESSNTFYRVLRRWAFYLFWLFYSSI